MVHYNEETFFLPFHSLLLALSSCFESVGLFRETAKVTDLLNRRTESGCMLETHQVDLSDGITECSRWVDDPFSVPRLPMAKLEDFRLFLSWLSAGPTRTIFCIVAEKGGRRDDELTDCSRCVDGSLSLSRRLIEKLGVFFLKGEGGKGCRL